MEGAEQEIEEVEVEQSDVEQSEDGDAAASTSSQQSIPGQRMDPAGAIEEELDELVATAAERDHYLALAQRTQADFENYRKRVARDAAQAQERGVAKLAKELLPALDNLDRALEAAAEEDPLLTGVKLVRSEIAAALTRVGIEAFAPLGEPFDPNLHEAMAQQPVEGAASGTVAEVYQNGYRMGDTIIRPARVLVAA
jgi:molecular chaperone GrpE